MNNHGCLLVSWDFSHNHDDSILLVGMRTPGKNVEVINAFQGKQAEELYKKLTTVKKG